MGMGIAGCLRWRGAHAFRIVGAVFGVAAAFELSRYMRTLLFGVEEPRCLIHAPNESVDPSEIEHMALAEALFLRGLAS